VGVVRREDIQVEAVLGQAHRAGEHAKLGICGQVLANFWRSAPASMRRQPRRLPALLARWRRRVGNAKERAAAVANEPLTEPSVVLTGGFCRHRHWRQ
jgi:hypothetical protein